MNISAAVLAITLCLEAQQHHSSLAEETPIPFALGSFPRPTFSAHFSPFHLSPCLSYMFLQRLSTVNTSAAAAAASAFFPMAFCFPHAAVCSPWLWLPQQREEAGISSQRELMVLLSCNQRWVERTSNNSHPLLMSIVTKHFSLVCVTQRAGIEWLRG